MNPLRRTAFVVALALVAVLSIGLFDPKPAISQGAPQAVTVYGPVTRDLGTLRTMTAAATGTYTSSDQSGFNISRVICVYNQTAVSAPGLPSTTFKIQNKDASSGLYYDLIQSAAVAGALNTPSVIAVGAGVASATNSGVGLPIAATWRVSATVGGVATATVTSKIGCSVQ